MIARPSVLSASARSVSSEGFEVLAIGLQADALVDVVLEGGEAAGIDGIDRRVVPVHLAEDEAQIRDHVDRRASHLFDRCLQPAVPAPGCLSRASPRRDRSAAAAGCW